MEQYYSPILTSCINDLIGGATQSTNLFMDHPPSDNSNFILEINDDEQIDVAIERDIFKNDPSVQYERKFANSYHHNWYGIYESKKPCVLSYRRSSDSSMDVILRTQEWTLHRIGVPYTETTDDRILPLKLLSSMLDMDDLTPIIRPCLSSYSLNRIRCYDDLFTVNNLNFGIVYQKPGQVTEEEMLSNCEETDTLHEFLTLIGRRIRLKGFRGHSGGLDVTSNSTGCESVYVQYKRVEIMFHVSTMLPYSYNEPQQIPRKRFIGNDNVCIIFQKSPTPFRPDQFKSKVMSSFIVVTPITLANDKLYKVQVYLKNTLTCTHTFPRIHKSGLFKRDKKFSEWIIQKLISLQVMAYTGAELSPLVKKMRSVQLANLVDDLEAMDFPYLNYLHSQMLLPPHEHDTSSEYGEEDAPLFENGSMNLCNDNVQINGEFDLHESRLETLRNSVTDGGSLY
ncbi:hypothetical protein ACOME3_001670 [Neoechinorhynchus agilis]